MNLTTFFYFKNQTDLRKLLTASGTKFKIKVMSTWTLSEILITSAVIWKQILLLENEIVQYLQNYKYKDVNQGHFGKPLQVSTKVIKNNYPKTIYTFLIGSSFSSYFLRLNC